MTDKACKRYTVANTKFSVEVMTTIDNRYTLLVKDTAKSYTASIELDTQQFAAICEMMVAAR